VLYVLSPALVFNSLSKPDLRSAGFEQIVVFELLVTAILGVLVWLLTRLLRFDRALESTFLLTTLFVNAGNYGIPLNRFAFGVEGEQRAVMYFAASSLLINTLAVFIASRGQATLRQSLVNVLKVPIIYAALLALIVNLGGLALPTPLARPIELAGNAAVPVMLLTLGIELSRSKAGDQMGLVLFASLLRLVAAAFIAIGLATSMGLQGVTRQVAIVEASMPTAVFTTILATEFDARPGFVTSVVLVTTLASVVTLTILLAWLM